MFLFLLLHCVSSVLGSTRFTFFVFDPLDIEVIIRDFAREGLEHMSGRALMRKRHVEQDNKSKYILTNNYTKRGMT